MGVCKDKDVAGCVRALLREDICAVHPLRGDSSRALGASDLGQVLQQAGLKVGSSSASENIAETVALALQEAGPDEVVLICGSFYVMAKARQAVGFVDVKDEL
jgi:folylpolyglutamate synthase/dihydropteroate synthase